MSMITASTWVPRGVPAAFPTKYEFDEDELDRISQLAKLQLTSAREALDAVQNGATEAQRNDDSDSDGDAVVQGARSHEYS